jgi:hypothetical protein
MEVLAEHGKIHPVGMPVLQATCQFPVPGLMKKMLTVKGSGCVASGHPVASARIGSPGKMTGARRIVLSDRSGAMLEVKLKEKGRRRRKSAAERP